MGNTSEQSNRRSIIYYGFSIFGIVTFLSFLYLDSQETGWLHKAYTHNANIGSYISFNQPEVLRYETEAQLKNTKAEPKYILFWNWPSFFGGRSLFDGCEYKCIITKNKFNISRQDAVIFHSPTLGKTPQKKPRGQVWIYLGVEPPSIYYANLHMWKGLFNWTVTYRRDSDIISRYATFGSKGIKVKNSNASLVGEISASKSKTAAWFVSNCRTQGRREQYVNILKKYIDVAVYGRCGSLNCRIPGAWGLGCVLQVEKDHRFYLSFENSLCRDYLTEKAFKVYKSNSLVPVVRGGANYSIYLPPNTFIDASDFKNATALSNFLIHARSNKTIISQLFQNRNLHNIDYNDIWGNKPFCELCRRLHHQEKYRRLYEDVQEWFTGAAKFPMCRIPTDIS